MIGDAATIFQALGSIGGVAAGSAGVVAAFIAVRQIKYLTAANEHAAESIEKLARSNEIAAKAMLAVEVSNRAQIVSHCAERYERIMSDLYSFSVRFSENVDVNEPTRLHDEGSFDQHRMPANNGGLIDWEKLWWYRVWDLYTEEFLLFRQGLLPMDFYEVWVNELCLKAERRPLYGVLKLTWKEGFRMYVDDLFQANSDVYRFYRDVVENIGRDYPDIPNESSQRAINRNHRWTSVQKLLCDWHPDSRPPLDARARCANALDAALVSHE